MQKKWKGLFAFVAAFVMIATLITGPLTKTSAETNLTGKLGPDLLNILNKATGSLGVIVTFKGDKAPGTAELNLLKQLGINKGTAMKSLPMVGVTATIDQIKALANETEVRSIYLNKKLTYYNADATDITGVDKLRTDEGMRKANGGMPVSGKGIGVVVNDSGVDATHGDLKDNVVQNVYGGTNLNAISGLLPITYTENVPNTDTNSGHGTHVAGTVGGTGAMSGGKYEGVAPGADMIGYGSGAALFVLDSIGGFDYAITHQSKYNIRVITNSWGSSGEFDPNDPVNIASYHAYKRGITVVFAAGNEGPGENTHNPYAKAPWVISVAAGEKDGTLADFSSRGTKGVGGTFEKDGKTWSWKDEPTLTAPGVDIISTRVIAPVSSLAITDDVNMIEPAYLPYYTVMSGTSMATPHVAGIVALMLEADPTLNPDEVKEILARTATNMPGYETWEVGAGYANAYAAVDQVFNRAKSYGSTLNAKNTFSSNVNMTIKQDQVEGVSFTPILGGKKTFTVPQGVTELTAKINAQGLLGQTGNPVNLVLIDPDGNEYSSGISLLFALYYDRTVQVTGPKSGEWTVEIRGLRGHDLNPLGIALPETLDVQLVYKTTNGFSGLSDISGHPAENAIKAGVSERLFDGKSGKFYPNSYLTRADLAKYLVMGAGVRQTLTNTSDPYTQAVLAKGAALRDGTQLQKGVMLSKNGTFAGSDAVTRAELAYSLVQSLGLEKEAAEAKPADGKITVQYKDERVPLSDSLSIPEHLKGYVQLALDLNIVNAYFSVSQGSFDLVPTVNASFKPNNAVTRGDFAVMMTRFYAAYMQ